ncbi:probable WRKY transcription factor 35 isoform X1 [Prosopis cineraria]|uniref:probable WRKY transcription factor 35 isoform X1 n=1 Tax=Prosopis cineraria TaxID=364024 RepID=UPI00240FA2D4|nr:probable WRKY transcription factor 35 isoform X1 [Prosopis cineraria]
MCSSIFGSIMDNNFHQGDLTDIFRASSGGGSGAGGGGRGGGSYGTSSSASELAPHDLSSTSSESWHHHHHQMNFSSVIMEDSLRATNFFGDPFSNMRDPFLQDLDFPLPSSYFSSAINNSAMEDASPGFSDSSVVLSSHHKLVEDDMRIRPPVAAAACNNNTIFSNMIQISPNSMNAKLPPPVSPCGSPSVNIAAAAINSSSSSSLPLSSPRGIEPSSSSSSSLVSAGNLNITVDNASVQISSPRNPGLKRRKSQAKKVVCIPAPAAANSRPSSGEVVPSDLWAWRKYGQKPIKGSPYPRGYYRCSSSKGCSARKQVERSRTDPNMLVITYTSEHNHPWPTQRNALAGSTRSQPSKNNNNASKNNSVNNSDQASTKPKEEEEQQQQQDHHQRGKSSSSSVKEEMEMEDIAVMNQNDQELEKMMMMEDDNNRSEGVGYKPCMLESNNNNNQSCEDFFAELGEIEADPLNLLFTQAGFNEEHQNHDRQRESKALDPFHLFDWSSSSSASADIHSTTTTSFEEPKRGL